MTVRSTLRHAISGTVARAATLSASAIVLALTVTAGSVHADETCSNCNTGLGGGGGLRGAFIGDLSPIEAGCQPRKYGQPDLFYNYYTQGNCNAANAQMYLSPLPVPANVGHTFYTYQPFYPHHMLYWHKDRYHNYYDNGRGLNRTKATYYAPPLRTAWSNLYWNKIRIPR